MTEISRGFGNHWNGNSILLMMTKYDYVYIGSKIYRFKTKSEINKYYSPVGNSGVPYPHAVDKENNFYLMIEDVVIKNMPKRYYSDPYFYYYDYMGKTVPTERKIQSKNVL